MMQLMLLPRETAAAHDNADLHAGRLDLATWRAMNAQNAGSTPYWRSPSRASPDSLSRMRR
jgi:hypothetical protein